MKKKLTLKNALTEIENIKFDPRDEILTEEGLFVLGNWKIIIDELQIFLQDGFFIGEKKYTPEDPTEIFSFIIDKDLKKYRYGNMSFLSFLKNAFSKNAKELEGISCILEIN